MHKLGNFSLRISLTLSRTSRRKKFCKWAPLAGRISGYILLRVWMISLLFKSSTHSLTPSYHPFRPIYSSVNRQHYDDVWKELPTDWLEGLDIKKQIASSIYREEVNQYKVKCGGIHDLFAKKFSSIFLFISHLLLQGLWICGKKAVG